MDLSAYLEWINYVRQILAVCSDTHGGLKVALMNPETILFSEDERGNYVAYHPQLSESQKFLWGSYLQNLQDLKDIADGAPIMGLHLGDECNGNKHPDLLVSDRIADQIIIAEYNALPMLDMNNLVWYRQVVGTGAHNFGFGSSAISLCHSLQNRYSNKDIRPLYHGLLDYCGVTVDYAHHGPNPGSRNWLKGNVARFYLRDIMQRGIMSGNTPPRLVLRGHYHVPVYELLEERGYTSELYILPSYSFLNDHSVQASQSQFEVTIGMNIYEIENGNISQTHRLHKTLDLRTVEVINNDR